MTIKASKPTLGRTLDSTAIKDLGQADKVSSTKDETTIVGGYGKEEEIKARINQIKAEIESSTSDYDSENLQERLAKLAGGVAVIGVGAATETELKEKKHRVEDALSATRASAVGLEYIHSLTITIPPAPTRA